MFKAEIDEKMKQNAYCHKINILAENNTSGILCAFKSLHGSKVGRESDLRSVPYVGVRSFVKNVKSLSENLHNSTPYKIT